ncbi:unnamed protein product, partial [Rotaria sp. Silwood2]
HTGIAKIFAAMNIALQSKEDHFEEIDKRILLPCIKKFQNESMQAAIYEAVDENDGEPTRLTVSGDRTLSGLKKQDKWLSLIESNTDIPS